MDLFYVDIGLVAYWFLFFQLFVHKKNTLLKTENVLFARKRCELPLNVVYHARGTHLPNMSTL